MTTTTDTGVDWQAATAAADRLGAHTRNLVTAKDAEALTQIRL